LEAGFGLNKIHFVPFQQTTFEREQWFLFSTNGVRPNEIWTKEPESGR